MLLLEDKRITTCANCGQQLIDDSDYMRDDVNLVLCDDCFQDNYSQCEDCDSYYHNDNLHPHKATGKLLCEDCESNYIYCDDCNEALQKEDEDCYYNDNNNRICESCQDNYIYCTQCEDTFHTDNAQYHNGDYYCDDCFNEHFRICDDCGETIDRDYIYYCEHDDCSYCEECYNSHSKDIYEFHFKQIDNDNGNTFNELKYNRAFGLELEISNEDIDYEEIENSTCFGCKEDSSLAYGAEFYSPILKGDKGIQEVEKLCNIVKDYSNDDTAGLHLHIDMRDNVENFEGVKKLYFMYNRIENIIYKVIAPCRSHASFAKKSQIDFETIYNLKGFESLNTLYRSAENSNGSRYFGFNLNALQDHQTIELRYREGITKFEDIKNWIKLNLYLFEYALANNIDTIKTITSNINNLERFIAFLSIIAKNDYKLINYWIKQYNRYDSKVAV